MTPRVLACASRWTDGRSVPGGRDMQGIRQDCLRKALLLLELLTWESIFALIRHSEPPTYRYVSTHTHQSRMCKIYYAGSFS